MRSNKLVIIFALLLCGCSTTIIIDYKEEINLEKNGKQKTTNHRTSNSKSNQK